jgi:hypothetical protein
VDDIRARVAYLNGLAEGLQIDASSPEGRVLSSVIDVLGDLAEQMTGLAEAHDEMADYVEDLDYDLGALEEAHYDNRDEVIRFVPATDLDDVDDDDVEVVCECGETDAFDGHHTHAD